MENVGQVLSDIYASEINFSITSFWDAGYEFKLGDSINGYKAEQTFSSFYAGVFWLVKQVQIHFPESEFVEAYS